MGINPLCPSRGADLTEGRNGHAKSIVLAAAGAICAPALAERANPGAIDSPGMLEEAVGRARLFLAAVALGGDWGSAICPVTLKGCMESAEAEKPLEDAVLSSRKEIAPRRCLS